MGDVLGDWNRVSGRLEGLDIERLREEVPVSEEQQNPGLDVDRIRSLGHYGFGLP
jgi:hypothetical protein